MEEREDLEGFINVLKNRYYNVKEQFFKDYIKLNLQSGYREGLFKGKSEVIQEGFDRGYLAGALFSALKVLEGSFINAEGCEAHNDALEYLDGEEIVKKIEGIKERLEGRVPEIKIASNLYIQWKTRSSDFKSNISEMPHSTQIYSAKSSFNMDELLDKAAHLQREQELFLRELESFKSRLERVETKFMNKKSSGK